MYHPSVSLCLEHRSVYQYDIALLHGVWQLASFTVTGSDTNAGPFVLADWTIKAALAAVSGLLGRVIPEHYDIAELRDGL